MASTSAFEIGSVAAAVDVPADGAEVPAAGAVDGEGAEVPFADPAEGAEEPAAAVTLAACLEPKMADTILPKTLIFFLLLAFGSPGYPPSRTKVLPVARAYTSKRSTSLFFGESIAWNSISTSFDLFDVFVGVYALIVGCKASTQSAFRSNTLSGRRYCDTAPAGRRRELGVSLKVDAEKPEIGQ